MITRRAFVATSGATLAGCRRKATGFPGYAFVANRGESSVAAVDLSRFAVARQIRLEAPPEAVVADAARGSVYVLAPTGGFLYEIDIPNLTVKRKLALGGTTPSMQLSPAGDGFGRDSLSFIPRAGWRREFHEQRNRDQRGVDLGKRNRLFRRYAVAWAGRAGAYGWARR